MGNFVRDDTKFKYINGDIWNVKIDPDMLSYPHLLKFIKDGEYGSIETLYYKAPHEPLEKLRVLWNDATTLDLTAIAIKNISCDIYVDHGIDEPEIIPSYLLTGGEGNVGDDVDAGCFEGGDYDKERKDGYAQEGNEGNGNEGGEEEVNYKGKVKCNAKGEDKVNDIEKGKNEFAGEVCIADYIIPPSRKCILSSYNPQFDLTDLEKGILFEDARKFKPAMTGRTKKKRVCERTEPPMNERHLRSSIQNPLKRRKVDKNQVAAVASQSPKPLDEPHDVSFSEGGQEWEEYTARGLEILELVKRRLISFVQHPLKRRKVDNNANLHVSAGVCQSPTPLDEPQDVSVSKRGQEREEATARALEILDRKYNKVKDWRDWKILPACEQFKLLKEASDMDAYYGGKMEDEEFALN